MWDYLKIIEWAKGEEDKEFSFEIVCRELPSVIIM